METNGRELMFRNRPLGRIELFQREALNAVFEIIWEGAESWCLISVTVFEHMPDIETLTVFHAKVLALTVALHIGWNH
jgi:hypothetical protein